MKLSGNRETKSTAWEPLEHRSGVLMKRSGNRETKPTAWEIQHRSGVHVQRSGNRETKLTSWEPQHQGPRAVIFAGLSSLQACLTLL